MLRKRKGGRSGCTSGAPVGSGDPSGAPKATRHPQSRHHDMSGMLASLPAQRRAISCPLNVDATIRQHFVRHNHGHVGLLSASVRGRILDPNHAIRSAPNPTGRPREPNMNVKARPRWLKWCGEGRRLEIPMIQLVYMREGWTAMCLCLRKLCTFALLYGILDQ